MLGATIIATGCIAAPALAQDSAAASQSDEGGIQDIVVTARKRVETTQDVPVSVTAISAEQIERYDLSSLERVAASTPQFVIGRAPSGSGATLVLRGIGSNSSSIGLEQSVAVIVDGVYYGQGRTINEGFFDLGRLEILKGPQALFFGKNATAGVVSITTADPGDKLEVIGRVGYEFAARQVTGEAIVSTPLTETLGIRVAVRGSKMYDGYYKNLATSTNYRTTDIATGTQTVHNSGPAGEGRSKEFYIRTTLKWEPTDRFAATLKGNFGTNNNDNPASSSVYYNCPTGYAAKNPNVQCARKFQSSANRLPTALWNGANAVPYALDDGALGNSYRSWAVTANLSYELDNITLTSVTNYNWNRNIFRFDADSLSASNLPSDFNGTTVTPPYGGIFATEWSTFHALSSEFRALTNYDGPVNLMVGGYYQKTKRDYLAWTASGGLENSAATPTFRRYVANSKDSQTEGETIAAFGQVIWKPVDKVEVTSGVRYTHETKDSYFIQPYSHPTRVTQGVFAPGIRLPSNLSFNNWSPEATISFKPNRDINLYAAYKTAYKSGGFSNSGIYSPSASLADFEFDPEKAKGFEVGAKTILLDRQLRFNVGMYRYKYSNLQLDFFNAPVFAFSTINAGSATTKGVELEVEFAPRAIEGLNLRGSVNYNKARYGNVPNAPCYTGQKSTAGCNLLLLANGTTRPIISGETGTNQNLKGSPTANAPLWTATLGASYETPVGNGLILGLSVDSRYSDNYLASAFGSPYTRQKAYVNLDASIRVKTEDTHWEFALIGKNLTDRWYATGGLDAPNTGSGTGTVNGIAGDQIGFANLPRTVQAQITFRY
ncbi:TonB-dependent receptor [Aquisediminimonas sediminicola]|uniref:TonB-dependent receptor n=1 Tax=Alteraquisediminimonas sediminicola TaxID=2676787 RepID=UPI001C8E3817|nr:TonB-dependent receptor [Aquisediminimonas sediminicola]